MTDVHIRFHFGKSLRASPEILEAAQFTLGAGESLLEEAELRRQDMEWWPRVWGDIISLIEGEIKNQALTDAEIVAAIPEDAYKEANASFNRERDRQRVRERFIKNAREKARYVMALGFMTRDVERIYHEGISKSRAAIAARCQLHAIVVTFAMKCGAASPAPDQDWGDDDGDDLNG